jgi:hypothetical protein
MTYRDDVNTPPTDNPLRANPVFWLIWILLGAAVLGGLATLAIALRNADRQLPDAYHWEGEHLERDFALARVAADHGIEVTLATTPVSGQCAASLRHAPGDPQALTVLFASTSDPGRDRVLRLARVAPGEYLGACTPLPAGRWRVAIEDDAGQWSIRATAIDSFEKLELRARNPEGNKDGAS